MSQLFPKWNHWRRGGRASQSPTSQNFAAISLIMLRYLLLSTNMRKYYWHKSKTRKWIILALDISSCTRLGASPFNYDTPTDHLSTERPSMASFTLLTWTSGSSVYQAERSLEAARWLGEWHHITVYSCAACRWYWNLILILNAEMHTKAECNNSKLSTTLQSE